MDNWICITWALAALSIAGNIFVIRKKAEGFWLWAVANVGWIIIDLRAGVPAQAALFAVYLGLSVYGIWEWKRKG